MELEGGLMLRDWVMPLAISEAAHNSSTQFLHLSSAQLVVLTKD